MNRQFHLLILLVVVVASTSIAIYSYPDHKIGDINATMYYDEPVCDSAEGYETNYELCDKEYDELVDEDEKDHKEWSEANNNNDQEEN